MEKCMEIRIKNGELEVKNAPTWLKDDVLEKIEELYDDLDLGEFGEEFITNYDGYISDCVSELADNYIDLYSGNLLEWAGENIGWIDDAISEFGWDGCGGTFLRAIQMGQYLANESELYDHMDQIVKGIALKYLIDTYDDKKSFGFEDVENFINCINADSFDTFSDIYDEVNEYFEDEEDEDNY